MTKNNQGEKMSKNITKEKLQEELESTIESNTIMKSAAQMVGFDVDDAVENALSGLEQRVRVGIWQKHRIAVLEGLLEELEQPK